MKEIPAGTSFLKITEPPNNEMILWATGGPSPSSPAALIGLDTENTSKKSAISSSGIVRPFAEIASSTDSAVLLQRKTNGSPSENLAAVSSRQENALTKRGESPGEAP
jgi:hypothetical protein